MLKLANKWYERKVISDDITLIFEPCVNPFLRCNIWHIRGRDRDLLIDTGLGVSFLKEEIGDLIDDPLSAVATHIHYDPVGCLHGFDERIMHRIEAPRMPHYSEFCWLRISDFPEELHHAMRSDDYPEHLLTAQPDVGLQHR